MILVLIMISVYQLPLIIYFLLTFLSPWKLIWLIIWQYTFINLTGSSQLTNETENLHKLCDTVDKSQKYKHRG